MPILNYTTSISAEKTAMEIQAMLAKAKAQAVLCEYDNHGIMTSISFRINTPSGFINYMLPSNIDGVYKALQKRKIISKFKTREHATRVAWRILKDWVEAQLAIVEAELADIKQVFLPYVQNNQGKTLYEILSENNFKQLTE